MNASWKVSMVAAATALTVLGARAASAQLLKLPHLGPAAPAESSGEVVHACVNDTNGNMRNVEDPSECREHEHSISWSMSGADGATGPTGPTGPTGATGPTGQSGIGEGSPCAGDGDCPATQHCAAGVCTADQYNGSQCGRSAQCLDGCCCAFSIFGVAQQQCREPIESCLPLPGSCRP
jgi:hypothetical protein